jgi:hypothetical protein
MAFMSYFPSIPIILYGCASLSAVACFVSALEIVQSTFYLNMVVLIAIRFFGTTYGCFYITYYIENLPKKVELTLGGII